MNNQKAFTLIELLVVVLIIGILAAVAVPQYQLAVTKSRVSVILPMLRSIKNAEETFYLANGQYTSDSGLLDIDRPATCQSVNADSWACDHFYIYLMNVPDIKDYRVSASYCPGYNYAKDYATCAAKRDFQITFRFSLYGGGGDYGDKLICTVDNNSALGKKICNSMFTQP